LTREAGSGARTWLIVLFLFLVRIPFLLIHHVQEDAYITFRTARHLAEQGDFSFNLHQHFPATTSLLYPFVVAAIDLLLHRHMILGVQLLGTLCVIAASYLAARALGKTQWQIVWVLLACWPVSLVVSYTGMETPLLLLALGMAVYGLGSNGHPKLFAASMLLLPLIRPDAIAYGLVFCAAMFCVSTTLVDRRQAIFGSAALIAGGGLLLIGNRLTTGDFLPTTMRAKEIAYHPSHAAAAVLGRLGDMFLRQSFLLPVSTSYLTRISPVLLVVTILAFVISFRPTKTQRERVLLGTLALLSIAVPAAYAGGGVIFDWYLYPANWLAMAVVIAVGVRLVSISRWRTVGWFAVAALWIALAGLQWGRSLVASTQDFHYRADIGRYLGEISHGQGTLLLEPAGYIPYYSGLRTDDEVGLVSGHVTRYMLRDPLHNRGSADGAWWMRYVEAEKPDYIVQVGSFAHFQTQEGYTLTSPEQQWFGEHYRLLRRAHYEPWQYHPSPFLRRILALGPMPDYLVFERRDLTQ
jgi:hypothetical protein